MAQHNMYRTYVLYFVLVRPNFLGEERALEKGSTLVVPLPGLEPRTTDPKSVVISISP